MAETVTASDGTLLDTTSLATAVGLDGSGNVITMTVNYPSKLTGTPTNYVQTFTRNVGGMVTNISEWVAT